MKRSSPIQSQDIRSNCHSLPRVEWATCRRKYVQRFSIEGLKDTCMCPRVRIGCGPRMDSWVHSMCYRAGVNIIRCIEEFLFWKNSRNTFVRMHVMSCHVVYRSVTDVGDLSELCQPRYHRIGIITSIDVNGKFCAVHPDIRHCILGAEQFSYIRAVLATCLQCSRYDELWGLLHCL